MGNTIHSPTAPGLAGANSWFAFLFPVFACLVAAAAHVVVRRMVRVGPALSMAAVALVGCLVLAELAMMSALDSMG